MISIVFQADLNLPELPLEHSNDYVCRRKPLDTRAFYLPKIEILLYNFGTFNFLVGFNKNGKVHIKCYKLANIHQIDKFSIQCIVSGY